MRQALYRLYRPKSFSEVVGQEHITTVLKNEMRAGTPSHAYLFIGSRGTGKTTCAKLVAKAANCLDLQNGDPCGKCDICRGVDDGSLTDVVEIDAASNNGVDNIRELRGEAVFTPAVAKYRVYIIDEVHMLSPSAFNALLKILEEPPEHVIFVLATTEVHKVLPTIISRCQRFDFQRIESSIIAKRLIHVAESEGFSLDDEAAQLIARLSDGGMRDALSLLDVCSSNSENVTVETVTRSAGLVGNEHLFTLSEAITAGDSSAVLEKIAELAQKSMDPQRLCEQLCGHYRNMMLVKTVRQPENLMTCVSSDIERMKKQIQSLSLNDILHCMSVLQDSLARMARSTTKRAELELALITLCDPIARTGYADLMRRIESLEEMLRKGSFTAAAAEQPAAKAEEAKPIQRAEAPKAEPVGQAASAEKPKQAGVQILPFAKWGAVLEQLAKINAPNYNMLRDTDAYFNGKQVLIDVSNPVILDMLRTNEYMKNNIKQAIVEATGERYGLGPYRPPEEKKTDDVDPLEKLIAALPKSPDIIIE
ncbi:MAG: DNA polymerase III subunit gamma/tau [Oscillospiraceae bacterium]|nr:DNA polymerase III subunit gamma/tau [Oscillospiraceae bacterium]